MDQTLVQKLVSHLPICNRYPTKHPKKEKPLPTMFHVSVTYHEVTDKDGNTKIVQKGHTYRKPKEQ